MRVNIGPQKISELFDRTKQPKPPAYEWQDLALRIINELSIPPFKKSAVFKVCKQYPKPYIEKAMNETKELAQNESWKYFFKLIENKRENKEN